MRIWRAIGIGSMALSWWCPSSTWCLLGVTGEKTFCFVTSWDLPLEWARLVELGGWTLNMKQMWVHWYTYVGSYPQWLYICHLRPSKYSLTPATFFSRLIFGPMLGLFNWREWIIIRISLLNSTNYCWLPCNFLPSRSSPIIIMALTLQDGTFQV